MKKILSLLLIPLILGSVYASAAENAVTVSSECDISDIDTPLEASVPTAAGQLLDIKAKSVILTEVTTGQILYEANSDEKTAPASITKIMSLLLFAEAIDRGAYDLETVVTASEHACSMGGSQIWLKPGEAMTVDDLLKATVIASANDACVALAELTAGSEESFTELMNRRAAELGMTDTHFENCTGLDAEGQLTTAHDVAIMSGELIKHEIIKKYSTVWMDTLRDGKSELVNTNKLVRFYAGTTGLKTGTTSTAKYCLSATAERDGLQLVAVVMAGESGNERFNGAKKLLDYGFANYSCSIIEGELEQTEIPVEKGVEKTVQIECNEQLSMLLPKTASGKITQSTALKEELTAPVKKGDKVGSITVYADGDEIGTLPVTAARDVERLTPHITAGWILSEILRS